MPSRFLIAALALSGSFAFAETKPQPGVEVRMILTAADHMNHRPPALQPSDVNIMDGTITGWVALEPGRDLELFFLIDDSANYDFGTKFAELRQFIANQPAAVSIGVAYIHEGALRIAANPTTDRAQLNQVLRAPAGGTAANPYCALSSLISQWKADPEKKFLRREIILVSAGLVNTGIDELAAQDAVCATAETAIQDAERAGVVVYSLYNPPADYASDDWSKVDAGLVSLAAVSYETGGEAYFTGHTPALSLDPFLADITEHLAHQYAVTFRLATPAQTGFQTIFITTRQLNQELMKPGKLWVK
jgi:hypothetical protein